MAHYKAVIAYDGSDFAGFQIQDDVRTVQGDIEAALAQLNNDEYLRIRFAGRTDAGVHARGQVIDFFLEWTHPDEELHRALNAILPNDIAVRTLTRTADDRFHSRFSATSRIYRYTIWNHPIRNPQARRWSLHETRALNHEAMNEAISALVGEHDFASFGRPPQGDVTIRRVLYACVRRQKEWVFVDVEANAFLYRMVRRIVGTLLPIGRGDMSVSWMTDVLARQDPDAAGPSVQPQGLCLMSVSYNSNQIESEEEPMLPVGWQETEA